LRWLIAAAVKPYPLITIPDIGGPGKATRGLLSDSHDYVAYGGAALVGLHVPVGYKHHFIRPV
jgi:cytochrome b561